MHIIDKFSWDDVDQLARQLAQKIDMPFDAVVCIMRGGAIPGVILANELRIDKVLSIKIVQRGQQNISPCYLDPGSDAPPYLGECAETLVPLNKCDLRNLNVLVVDDVLDSGESAKLVVDTVLSRGAATVRLATLHVKTYSPSRPDYYVEEKVNWLFYPWMSNHEFLQMEAKIKRQLVDSRIHSQNK